MSEKAPEVDPKYAYTPRELVEAVEQRTPLGIDQLEGLRKAVKYIGEKNVIKSLTGGEQISPEGDLNQRLTAALRKWAERQPNPDEWVIVQF